MSNASSFLLLLSLVFLSLLVSIVIGANPLSYKCSNTKTNATSSTLYQNNLNKLIASLYLKTPFDGFGLGSVGLDQDQAHGLALCRGDVNVADCRACVGEAGSDICTLCPYETEAIVWYDACLLKYSNTNFFGEIDTQNTISLFNVANVSDPIMFNKQARNLLSLLSKQAFVDPKMVASGDLDFDESIKIYGYVQCTRDLSNVDCKNCIDSVIGELPYCCDGKQGGRVIGGSCKVHYEIYPFINA